MKKWQDLFHEKMPQDFASRVLKAAELEMAKGSPQKLPKFFTRWQFLGGLAAAVATIFLVSKQEVRPHGEEFELLSHDGEMLSQMDFFSELDTLEDWDEIEAESKGD